MATIARDRLQFDILRDGPLSNDLDGGRDEVFVQTRDKEVERIRLTFSRSEVGNGEAELMAGLPGQTAGLAVSMQAADDSGTVFGPVSRFDDEGITFRTQGNVKFDVRDLGASNSTGLVDIVVLGTSGADAYDFSDKGKDYYVHAGNGNDQLSGGLGNDYLIGGFGDDSVTGNGGNDVLVGGPGNDQLFGGAGNDVAIYRHNLDGADVTDLGSGDDTVQVLGPAREIRLTWSTLQTGNGDPEDSGTLANEDGGLNVRLQAEDSAGNLVGPVSRFDDEGISFIGAPGITFDLRNLPDGVMRGNGYGIVRFGSSGADIYDDGAATVNVFHNGGQGDDWLIGGAGSDHLVGLDGNDRLEGGAGNDLLVGLGGSDTFVFAGSNPGRDTILTYQPGTDRIDLSAFGIAIEAVVATQIGPNSLLRIDTDGDGAFNFEIFLGGSALPTPADYIF